MFKKTALTALLLVSVNVAIAVQGEVIIDNFEDGDISDWLMLYDVESEEQNISLGTSAHSGQYAVVLWDSEEGDFFVDFAKENIGIELNHSLSYYNISFWYQVQGACQFPHYSPRQHKIYISDEETFAWSTVEVRTGDIMSCDGWQRINIALNSPENDIFGSFSLNSSHLGSINIENGENLITYDDIKLIPRIPEVECVPDWSCTEWSGCSNGAQTRTCADSNNCDDFTGMPETEKACGISIEVVQPTKSNFLTGESFTITLNVTYTNSSPVSGLDLSIGLCNSEIPLNEEQVGIYSVTCMPNSSDIGVWEIALSGVNATFGPLTISISEQPQVTFEPLIGIMLEICPYIIILFVSIVLGVALYWLIKKVGSRPKKRKREKDRKTKKKKKPKSKGPGLHEVKLG